MILILIRGLPGSGKSSLAKRFDGPCFAADDYFTVDGEYRFNPSGLKEAHAQCQRQTAESLVDRRMPAYNRGITVVANTFSCLWEMEPYFEIAECRLYVIDLFDGGLTDEELFERNVHGVPLKTISDMRARWEHDWKAGNPLPPWER